MGRQRLLERVKCDESLDEKQWSQAQHPQRTFHEHGLRSQESILHTGLRHAEKRQWLRAHDHRRPNPVDVCRAHKSAKKCVSAPATSVGVLQIFLSFVVRVTITRRTKGSESAE